MLIVCRMFINFDANPAMVSGMTWLFCFQDAESTVGKWASTVL